MPVRTCIGCKKRYGVGNLDRISFAEPDVLTVGGAKGTGKGAWVCAGNEACLEKALRSEILSKRFGKKISFSVVRHMRENC